MNEILLHLLGHTNPIHLAAHTNLHHSMTTMVASHFNTSNQEEEELVSTFVCLSQTVRGKSELRYGGLRWRSSVTVTAKSGR